MKDINELYERLLKNYKSLQISIQTETMSKGLNDSPYEYEIITIIKDENKMIVYEDMIQIYKQNKFITEQEGETLDEIYELISRQVFNWYAGIEIKEDKNDNTINTFLMSILIVTSFIAVHLITKIFPALNTDFFMIFIVPLITLADIIFILLLYDFCKKKAIQTKQKKIKQEDTYVIDKYCQTNKNWELLSEYDLVMFFEAIDFICRDFYKMEEEIVQKNLFDNIKIKGIIEKSDEEIKQYYKLGMNAINFIYKYYDETGKRKI